MNVSPHVSVLNEGMHFLSGTEFDRWKIYEKRTIRTALLDSSTVAWVGMRYMVLYDKTGQEGLGSAGSSKKEGGSESW